MTAPIALFVYNRPEHTRQTIEALRENSLARQSDLVIFSDAPKNPKASAAVAEVREHIRTVDGFKSVTIVEREENWGLARSIISGVTLLCEKYGRAIVLEDDLVSSPFFLTFMNEALDLYAGNSEVMHISGSTYPVEIDERSTSYFLKIPLCWGWATWDRAWSKFSKDIAVMERFTPAMISRFNFDGTNPTYWGQLQANRDGRINTWFIFWYAHLFLTNGLALFPKQSLLQNIGMDGTGVPCDVNDAFFIEMTTNRIELKPLALEESASAFERHKRYFKKLQPTILARAINKLKRVAGVR